MSSPGNSNSTAPGAPAASRTATSQGMIAARDVSKVYRTRHGQTVTALENVSFDIGAEEFVSVVGPSGCGKTTLLRIVGGLIEASSGEILFRGRPIREPQRNIGIVFQKPTLLPWCTVLENVLLPVRVQRLDVAAYRQKALELLEMVGLKGFENAYPWELSGGMQQRNAIVRALITDPDVLLMDEPFGALDAMTREMMSLELQRIWQTRKKTVIFITHSISEAVFLSDRVFVMTRRPGRISEIVHIPMPRPRTLDMMNSDEAGAFVSRIRRSLALNDNPTPPDVTGKGLE